MNSYALTFIQDLAVIMIVTACVTVICYWLKQPVVLGYIIAGVIIGPYIPPFALISNPHTINILAELGVIFLMFSLGLEFNLHKLKRVGGSAFIASFLEIVLMMLLGYEVGKLFGWTQFSSIFLGAILAISSTTIIVKTLDELKLKNKQSSQLIFGILIVEDIFAILILTFLSSIAIAGSLEFIDIIASVTKLTSFLILSLVIGILLVPKILSYIAKLRSNEILLITVLGLCFGFCLLVAKLGYSTALGAFIMGAIIAESRQLVKIEGLIHPIRDMFCAIFFVSVGLLFDPHILQTQWLAITIITVLVIFGKIFSNSLGMLLTGRGPKTALQVGMGLAQIGEFSFIIAALGMSLKVTDGFLYDIAVCVSVITTLFTPFLITYSDAVALFLNKIVPSRIKRLIKLYLKLIKSIHPHQDNMELLKIIRRCIVHIIINLFIVIAVFLMASFIAKTEIGKMILQITDLYFQKTIIWAVAFILSLPSLVAAYRKIKALTELLSELSISGYLDEKLAIRLRGFISNLLLFIATIAIVVLILMISAKILPPFEILVFIIAIIGFVSVLALPWIIKLHSMVQISIVETLNNTEKDNKINKINKDSES